TSRHAQMTGGRRSAIVARPKACIRRSATMAPGRPRTFRAAWSVAWLRLRSSTVQVARLAATAAISAMRLKPKIAPRFRRTMRRAALSAGNADVRGIDLVERMRRPGLLGMAGAAHRAGGRRRVTREPSRRLSAGFQAFRNDPIAAVVNPALTNKN